MVNLPGHKLKGSFVCYFSYLQFFSGVVQLITCLSHIVCLILEIKLNFTTHLVCDRAIALNKYTCDIYVSPDHTSYMGQPSVMKPYHAIATLL